MEMTKYVVLAALLAVVTSVPAAVIYWDIAGAPTTTDWSTAANWDSGTVPGAADHVILHNADLLGPDPLVAGAAAPNINIFGPSWHDGQSTILTVGAGGSLGVGSFTRLSGGNNSSSTVNFLPGAGISTWGLLQMSFNNAAGGLAVIGTESDSFINLDGGILHLGGLGFSNNGFNTTQIDIGLGGTLLVNGDHTTQPWIGNGWITGLDGAGTVSAVFDAGNARTVFTAAIPEPATFGLFAMMGGGILWVRKRFAL